jgi:hypothetical protein
MRRTPPKHREGFRAVGSIGDGCEPVREHAQHAGLTVAAFDGALGASAAIRLVLTP